MKSLYVLIPLAALLASCGPSGTGNGSPDATRVIAHTAKSAQDFMPLQEGNSWTYKVSAAQRVGTKQPVVGAGQTTMKAGPVKETPAGKQCMVSLINNGKTVSKVGFMTSSKGVFQTGAYSGKVNSAYSPALPLMLWPAEIGKSATWNGSGILPAADVIGQLKSVTTYRGESEVDTGAGRIKAVRFDTTQTYTVKGQPYTATQSAWFAAEIGLVRSVEIVESKNYSRTIELKLQSYTVK